MIWWAKDDLPTWRVWYSNAKCRWTPHPPNLVTQTWYHKNPFIHCCSQIIWYEWSSVFSWRFLSSKSLQVHCVCCYQPRQNCLSHCPMLIGFSILRGTNESIRLSVPHKPWLCCEWRYIPDYYLFVHYKQTILCYLFSSYKESWKPQSRVNVRQVLLLRTFLIFKSYGFFGKMLANILRNNLDLHRYAHFKKLTKSELDLNWIFEDTSLRRQVPMQLCLANMRDHGKCNQ